MADDITRPGSPDTAAGPHPWHMTLEQAQAAGLEPGRASALLFSHGSMQVRYYAPRLTDPQQPHDQDELYIVADGYGWFVNGDRRHPFAPGDVLFVPAGQAHRFEDFTEGFGVWVVFYRPDGGEGP